MSDRQYQPYNVFKLGRIPKPTTGESMAIRQLFRGSAGPEAQKMAMKHLLEMSGMNAAPDPAWSAEQMAFFNGMSTLGRVFASIGEPTLMSFVSEDAEKQGASFPLKSPDEL